MEPPPHLPKQMGLSWRRPTWKNKTKLFIQPTLLALLLNDLIARLPILSNYGPPSQCLEYSLSMLFWPSQFWLPDYNSIIPFGVSGWAKASHGVYFSFWKGTLSLLSAVYWAELLATHDWWLTLPPRSSSQFLPPHIPAQRVFSKVTSIGGGETAQGQESYQIS